MADRVLRGSRLGAVSYETDRNTEFVARQTVEYTCPAGHEFTVPFAADAEVPPTWECKVCGEVSLKVDGERPEAKAQKPARTHWDMLIERRTIDELEEVLAERLAVLHAHQPNRRKSA